METSEPRLSTTADSVNDKCDFTVIERSLEFLHWSILPMGGGGIAQQKVSACAEPSDFSNALHGKRQLRRTSDMVVISPCFFDGNCQFSALIPGLANALFGFLFLTSDLVCVLADHTAFVRTFFHAMAERSKGWFSFWILFLKMKTWSGTPKEFKCSLLVFDQPEVNTSLQVGSSVFSNLLSHDGCDDFP